MSQTDTKFNKTFSPINMTHRSENKQFTDAHATRKKKRPFQRLIILAGFVVLVGILGTVLYNVINNESETSPSNQVKSVFSGDEMRDYNSPENKFIIKMPGFPQIDKTTVSDGGKDIPITSYQRIIEDGAKNYSLKVYDYTGFNLDPAKAIEVAMNSSLQNTPGATILETKKGTYNDLQAIEAKYSLEENGKTYESHIRFVMKDSHMYSIILIGGDQAKFDEYANSLRLS